MWPWGGARNVQEKLVRSSQLETRRTNRKKDPKALPLASAALLEFIGPAHSSEELRLPAPLMPLGEESSHASSEREELAQALERGSPGALGQLQKQLLTLNVPAERLERLKSMLSYEENMLRLVGEVSQALEEIERLRQEAQQEEGY